MTEATSSFSVRDQGKRTKAFAREFQALYAAQLVQALLGGDLPKSDDRMRAYAKAQGLEKVPEPVVTVMMKALGKLDGDQREKLSELLLTTDPETGKPRPDAEVDRLRKLVDPSRGSDLLEKMDIKNRIRHLWFGELEEVKDPDQIGEWVKIVWSDAFPTIEPRDADPDDPSSDQPEDGQDDDDASGQPDPSTPFPPWTSILRFNVEQVRCVETTNELGRDEIVFDGIGGNGTTILSSGQTNTNLQALNLQDCGQFRRNDTFDFNPPLPFCGWSLHDKTMPHLFSVIFVLAELDYGGGLSGFMSDLMVSVAAEIDNITAEILASVLVPFFIGGVATTLVAGPIGAVVFAAFAVFALSIGLITNNRDDVLDVHFMSLPMYPGSLSQSPFSGNARTPTETATIQGQGGIYQVRYHWDII